MNRSGCTGLPECQLAASSARHAPRALPRPRFPAWGRTLLAILAVLLSPAATAGSIAFDLTIAGAMLSVTNRGDTAAFHPRVFRLDADGNWQRLQAGAEVVELAPGATVQVAWPALPAEARAPIERIKPVMVLFYDQAGTVFGNTAFLGDPPSRANLLRAAYDGNVLRVAAPAGAGAIAASWLIWAPEKGIAGLAGAFEEIPAPAPALRVDWRALGAPELRQDMGRGRPEVLLVHQTGAGFALQSVPSPRPPGREQRTAWLDLFAPLYGLATTALLTGIALLATGWAGRAAGKEAR